MVSIDTATGTRESHDTVDSPRFAATGAYLLAYAALTALLVGATLLGAAVIAPSLSSGVLGLLALWLVTVGLAGAAPRIARELLSRVHPGTTRRR